MGNKSSPDLKALIEALDNMFNFKIVYIFHNGKEVIDYGDNEFNL